VSGGNEGGNEGSSRGGGHAFRSRARLAARSDVALGEPEGALVVGSLVAAQRGGPTGVRAISPVDVGARGQLARGSTSGQQAGQGREPAPSLSIGSVTALAHGGAPVRPATTRDRRATERRVDLVTGHVPSDTDVASMVVGSGTGGASGSTRAIIDEQLQRLKLAAERGATVRATRDAMVLAERTRLENDFKAKLARQVPGRAPAEQLFGPGLAGRRNESGESSNKGAHGADARDSRNVIATEAPIGPPPRLPTSSEGDSILPSPSPGIPVTAVRPPSPLMPPAAHVIHLAKEIGTREAVRVGEGSEDGNRVAADVARANRRETDRRVREERRAEALSALHLKKLKERDAADRCRAEAEARYWEAAPVASALAGPSSAAAAEAARVRSARESKAADAAARRRDLANEERSRAFARSIARSEADAAAERRREAARRAGRAANPLQDSAAPEGSVAAGPCEHSESGRPSPPSEVLVASEAESAATEAARGSTLRGFAVRAAAAFNEEEAERRLHRARLLQANSRAEEGRKRAADVRARRADMGTTFDHVVGGGQGGAAAMAGVVTTIAARRQSSARPSRLRSGTAGISANDPIPAPDLVISVARLTSQSR